VNEAALPAETSDPLADFRRSNIRAAVVIGVIAVLFGAAIGYWNPVMNHAAAVQGDWVDLLFRVLLGIAATVFMVVEAVLLYSIIKFRSRGGEGDEDEGLPIHGHTGLEMLWTAIPAILVTATALASYGVLVINEAPQPNPIIVEVTGQQFAWSYYYPSLDVRTNELHVPVGQQVLARLTSKDVIHQFWIPAFRIKRDVMPDRVTEIRFTATQEGAYPIVCTKICGAGHSVMRSQVVVQKPDDYDAWLSGLGPDIPSCARRWSCRSLTIMMPGCPDWLMARRNPPPRTIHWQRVARCSLRTAAMHATSWTMPRPPAQSDPS
jgi:cytochrome c oxidase subunit II